VNTYTFGTIEKAVRLFGDRATRNEVASAAKFDPHDATRVRLMREAGLLRLNDRGKLVLDARVARVGRRLALRYLDERGERWLDPIKNPPPLPRG
jgi:hypothetical protein